MPKRKRDNDEEGSNSRSSAQLSVRQKRVRFKIDAGTKALTRAFKLARGFERQKLGRRMKKAVAENNQKDVERITAEVAAAKALDIIRPAQHHLFKSLMRIKAVADHPNLPDEVRNPGVLATDTPTLNVNARLCNSNPVTTCMKETLADIQKALGLDVEGPTPGKKARVRAKDLEVEKEEVVRKEKKNSKGGVTLPVQESVAEEDEDEDDEELSHAPAVHDGQDQGSEEDASAYDHLVADSDGSDDNEEDNDSIAELERQLAEEGIKTASKSRSTKNPQTSKPYSLAADLDISDDEDASEASSSEADAHEPRKPGISASKTTAAPKKSAFVPSLTLGGYISGSGSDFEDHGKLDFDAPLRKNRRGQRARQAIWEKKYGTKANHLKKGPAEGKGRDQGWDPKRGATMNGHGARGGGRGGFAQNGAASHGRGAAAKEEVKKKRDDSGPIHPSWEAAKRAKEKKEAPVAFAGKKTTFD